MPVEEFESAPILQRCLAKYPPVKIQIFPVNSNPRRPFYPHFLVVVTLLFFLLARPGGVRAEAMLQLFNVNWDELVQKMPEIAEAGYTSLWLPPPAKAGSVYSVGYDLFDPFDLGDKYQRGTVRTKYGTKQQLLQAVEIAHRFGLRVYFDNIMNHRGFDIPGYNSGTPTNLYPGLVPGDFHLKTVGANFQNWPDVGNWSYVDEVQRQPLFGLVDIANEGGVNNLNFGNSLFNTAPKPVWVRQPGNPEYYMVTNLPAIAGPWRPFKGTNGVPVAEDVNSYLIRAALWMLNETKCDGYRFDAVKHVPAGFFGDTSSDTPNGYTGAIQAMYDYVHGFGNNATGNGYVETGGNRDSGFDPEITRTDALLFGEHLGTPPPFYDYINNGMRLVNSPYHNYLNSTLGNPSGTLDGLQNRDFRPYGDSANFTGPQSVLFAQSHDDGVATHRELQEAYNFMREGLPSIYTDGYNQATATPPDQPFPRVALAPYLGQFGDNKMPEVAYLHHQLARGGTRPRWGDADIAAFERYDYREGGSAADQTVVLFAMNDNYASDIAFVDGEGDIFPSAVTPPGSLGDKQGMVVDFLLGTRLVQLASSGPNASHAFATAIVRPATNVRSVAQGSGGGTVYVGGQTIPAGGGAIEILVPSGGYVMYGMQWPEASRVNPATNAILFRQGGTEVPRLIVRRTDGVNGDAGFNPAYPFKMRGSVNPLGNLIGGVNVSNRTYAIDIPVVTNANFDIVVRSDASSVNTLVKLDGGTDVNSQMGLGPMAGGVGPNGPDLRDNKPGYATDVFLGYEQAAFQFRNSPEKFAAKNTLSNNIISLGAETYCYTVGGTNFIVPGAGNGQSIGQTAAFVYHDPADGVTITNNALATQRLPLAPTNGQPVDIYVKIGYANYINTCFIYYTTDGTNPEGAFGIGKGTTKVVQALFNGADNPVASIDWWKVTVPGQLVGTQVRYKFGAFYGGSGGSLYAGFSSLPISDADPSGAKLYGLTQAAITNFNPNTAVVWLHNDLNTNNTTTGLQSGFHIVRARSFLPRTNQSSVFNTFAQTFYYDGALPTGAIPFPANNSTLGSRGYTVVVRADSPTTGADFNIQDGDAGNDDAATGKANGNGNLGGAPAFVAATAVSPDAGLSAQYPNLPQEFRFVYTNIPGSGPATINVRLKEFATGVYTNRFTLLTATVTNAAPVSVVQISSPAASGMVLNYTTNMIYLVQACFSTALAFDKNSFNVFINGVLQPQASYFVRAPGSQTPNLCPGLNTLNYNWSNPPLGTNLIQVIFTNGVVISDERLIIVAPPLRISGLANNNQLVVWDSVSGVNYQVLATTNLAQPFLPISNPIPGSGTSTFFYDPNPAPQKFYEIQMVP